MLLRLIWNKQGGVIHFELSHLEGDLGKWRAKSTGPASIQLQTIT